MIQSVSTAEHKTEYLRRLSGKPYFEAVLGTHLRLFGQHPASGWAFYLLPGTAVLELRGGSAVVCGALPGGGAGEDAREELAELEGLGVEALREHSASLVRVLRPGMRLDPEEVHAMQLATLRGRLAADERELKRMNIALSFISDDPYYLTVEARYLRGVGDYDIAERLNCDPSTVRRNRIRLVRMLALRLYGMGGGACGSSF